MRNSPWQSAAEFKTKKEFKQNLKFALPEAPLPKFVVISNFPMIFWTGRQFSNHTFDDFLRNINFQMNFGRFNETFLPRLCGLQTQTPPQWRDPTPSL